MFAQRQLEYLGHIMAGEGVRPMPEKVQAIQTWPTPRSPWALRGFLGLAGFYWRFIRGYVALATPFTKLLCMVSFSGHLKLMSPSRSSKTLLQQLLFSHYLTSRSPLLSRRTRRAPAWGQYYRKEVTPSPSSANNFVLGWIILQHTFVS